MPGGSKKLAIFEMLDAGFPVEAIAEGLGVSISHVRNMRTVADPSRSYEYKRRRALTAKIYDMIDAGKTRKEISDALNLKRIYVKNIMWSYRTHKPISRQGPRPPKEPFVDQRYVEAYNTVGPKEAAKLFGVTPMTIINHVRRAGVPSLRKAT